jgi:hypothetical protein
MQVESKIATIAMSLRDRMRFYKLRVTANAAQIASQFNEHFKAETVTELTDIARVKWIQEAPNDDIPLIGDDVRGLQSLVSCLYDKQELTWYLGFPTFRSAEAGIRSQTAYSRQQSQYPRLLFYSTYSG